MSFNFAPVARYSIDELTLFFRTPKSPLTSILLKGPQESKASYLPTLSKPTTIYSPPATMSTFTSPTPGLDLTLQNLANSATIVQAIAYYQQNDHRENSNTKQWKRIGKVAVTLIRDELIIPREELEALTDDLAGWGRGL